MVNPLRRLTVYLTLLFLILVPLSLILYVSETQAAGNIGAVLSPPNTSKFPEITTNLDVRDENGVFVSGLQASQVSVYEDDQKLPVTELSEIHPGAQFVLALNPGRSFAIRDANGKSRYDSLLAAIQAWAKTLPDPAIDDLSLIIANGPQIIHNSAPQQLQAAIQSYQLGEVPDNPDLNVLSSAVETVADATSRQGMGRAILFITSLPSIDITVGLKSLAGSASQQGVHISIWLVASSDQANSPVAVQLQDLANQTHGQYFFYTGSETLPDIQSLVQPMQKSYSLAYQSKIASSVPHKLSAQIETSNGIITTTVQTFELNIQAPNPIFVSPPSQILRESPSSNQKPTADLLPVQQPLDILIEFPDGISRPILTSTLYIDGAAAAINRSAPFNKFTWDLSGYTTDGDHLLRVEVVDALGLRGASRDLPIHITVKRTAQGLLIAFYRNGPLLAGLAALLAGAVLLLVLLLGGRIKPIAVGRGVQPGVKVRPAEKTVPHKRSDPVTQPVLDAQIGPIARHRPAWMNRLQWPQHRASPKAIAYLSRLSESDQEKDTAPIPIEAEEVTLGTDPIRANLAIDDPSIEPLHACLRREGDTYRLCDQGSVAGTWVNYSPVSSEGVVLEHADIIHIGRVGFRFTLRQPGKIRKPVVRPEAPKP